MATDIENKKTKQSFTKIATTKKRKKKRTWVITYRLVDGPPVELGKPKAAKKKGRRKVKSKTAPSKRTKK